MMHTPLTLLIIAIGLLFAAHVARAMRWAALFPKKHSGTRRKSLLIGLGIGYAVNALIPLRIGEIVRGIVVSRLNRIRLAEVIATIVAERVADLAVLALIISAFAPRSSNPGFASATALLFALAAGLALLGAMLVRGSTRVRRALWLVAGIFNDGIRIAVTDFIWSTTEMLVGGTLLRWKFTLATVGMWSLYGAAYGVFGLSVGQRLMDVVAAMVEQPLRALVFDGAWATGGQNSFAIFALAPVLIILLLEPLIRTAKVSRATRPLHRLIHTGRSSHDARSERFNVPMGYADFLRSLFSGENRAVSGFGLDAIDDCIVHKFYHGGSDALTALVETDQRLVIRKFAAGRAALKLKEQVDWLRGHASTPLPLVEIIADRKGDGSYSYDMPLLPEAIDFYDAIHLQTQGQNQANLQRVFTQIDILHRGTAVASDEIVARYLAEKAAANANAIATFAKSHLGTADVTINGSTHNWSEWGLLTDPKWLAAQVRQRGTTSIHGDLTIENIILAPTLPDGLYVIDPNPDNIFDTPLIDWAKLMQSLHLGYEGLNRGVAFKVSAGALTLPDIRSEAYAVLHRMLESEICVRFGDDGLRETYFNEIVHYLRLTPYKMRQSPERGLAFFAATALLLQRYQARFA